MSENRIMAACGLICNTCPIHNAPNNPEVAQRLAEDFKGQWENVKPEDFRCEGCWGEDEEIWSPDCEIRKCCIKEKKLKYCYECNVFPCDILKNWAKQNEGYMEGLNKLKEIKKTR
ncbi:MAG: DUF3795 domain-containing protein [Promethearchaeota archaeon]